MRKIRTFEYISWDGVLEHDGRKLALVSKKATVTGVFINVSRHVGTLPS